VKEQRAEFLKQAQQPSTHFRKLCQDFGISHTPSYKWLHRNTPDEHSRRPHRSPRKTPAPVEHAILALCTDHPYWGPRKLRQRLAD